MSLAFENGTSRAANFVRDSLARCERGLQKSAALGVEALIRGELADAWDECSVAGWDGYNALPVTWDSLNLAEQFLRSLPLGSPLPSLGAEPDGHVTMEWGRRPRRRLSISFSPDGELHYAALTGPGRTCGSEPFLGEVPETIMRLIRQVA